MKNNDPPTQELLDIATALNPRFKMKYSSEVSQESVKARLTREMKEMTETPVMQMPVESDDTEEAKKKRRKKGLSSFFKVPEGTSPGGAGPALHPDEAIALELQAYLQAATLDTEEDPLEWWNPSQKLFPKLSLLAKKYLCTS
ncbi:zinc finger BED domain-containing protein 4-like [Nothobranchius furzeri]|uniref:zinc finger BED domain-containing protein 4-like n=1 Tax=Nothobranchius furzeri TaxID=105023 RepID=UPI00390498F0